MASARLFLIRHGHTAGNGGIDQRLSGWTDFVLSPRGHAQVERLRSWLLRSEPFSVIYCSPLARAIQTAGPLVDAGLGPLRRCEGLKEIYCGALDGWPIALVQRQFPELWAANLRQDDDDFRWPGGESYRDLRSRALATAGEIADRHAEQKVALVTHAGIISQLVGTIEGSRPAEWERFRSENTAVTELLWNGGRLELVKFDDRAHLAQGDDPEAAAPARH